MSYIGRGTESISNVEVLDNLTFNGSASYTLQKSSVNFVPSSANNLLISISGVVQQGNFSVSGSTITFDTTVSASDTCDWILHYGTGLITTVADGTITEAKLGNGAVTNAKLQNSSITLNGSAVSLGGSATIGGGKIGQVLTAQPVTSDFNTSSSSYVDVTNLNASITPTATSSKILVLFYGMLYASGGSQGVTSRGRILRGSTALNSWQASTYDQGNSGVQSTNSATFTILDSPSTTSQVTYKIQIKLAEGSNATLKAGANNSDNSTPTFVLMEVLA